MRHEEVPDELRPLIYDFFFWFSRFEFALKEAHFLKSKVVGDKAEPGWSGFIEQFKHGYVLSAAGKSLIAANPRRQVVGAGGLDFVDLHFKPNTSDLERVVRLSQAVRNNLFHGGKHGSEYWDKPKRTRCLLEIVKKVLNELADLSGLSCDYRSFY